MKSHITNEPLEIMWAIYKDAYMKCSAKVSMRDLMTIKSRLENEGMSFLTITLPKFCQAFERSLEQGSVAPRGFENFKFHGLIPAFLQGLIGRIFSKETGRIFDNDKDVSSYRSPRVHACLVDSVRQICLAFKKVKLPCTPLRENKAMEGFVENERSFQTFPLPKEDDSLFKLTSSMLWDNIIRNIRVDMLVPRHGPGQTAERISGNRKYSWRFWHERLEPYFPFIDNAYSINTGADVEKNFLCTCFPISTGEIGTSRSRELDMVTFVHQSDEPPARVVTVPKTLKSPRIIAIEPCCNQYTQQAIRRELYQLLSSYHLTSGHIEFRDQQVNGSLALDSSKTGRLATIDLSDASDLVPVGYSLWMFRSNPDLKDAIEASRSSSVNLPDGRNIVLRKFAPMGSALCFPVEAMYFYTVCVVALLVSNGLSVSHENIKFVSRDVYVYGDDILVPSEHAEAVLFHLRKYNCKVNVNKTFYLGKFRESCGVDAYDGIQVNPVYINRLPAKNRRQSKEILSNVACANHFQKKGYVQTSSLLFNKVERVLGRLPGTFEESPVVGRNSSWVFDPPKRWNKKFQHFEVLCWIQGSVYRTDELNGYAALQKSLEKLNGLKDLWVDRDSKHLTRSALHGEATIKRRWVPETFISGLVR